MQPVSRGRKIFDIETDGFLTECTTMWMLITRDIDTDEVKVYLKGDLSWQHDLSKAGGCTLLVGHYIEGFDLLVLKKLFGWVPDVATVDTVLMSQTLDYKRFPSGKHNLEVWGEFLGVKKIEFDPAKFKNPTFMDLLEMEEYCVGDTATGLAVYLYLIQEYKEKVAKRPLLKNALRIEHDTARYVGQCELNGWLMDREAAEKLFATLEASIKEAEATLQPLLKLTIKPKDKEPKTAKFIKSGAYAKTTADWFGIDPERGKTDRPIQGAYTRVEILQPDASSMEAIKAYLYSIGWVPDDWNYKKVGYEFIKQSPKLTETSLLPLGPIGSLVNDLTTTRSRRDILRGWIENLDSNNRLHGSCFTIATPTGRARHEVLVNVPSADADWGPDIRKLFIARPGFKIVGADSSGNQFRALCHYLKNDEFTNLVLNGDVHQANADILSSILGIPVKRGTAKPFIYAFLFGAGGEKLELILTGKRGSGRKGNKAKNEFIERVPGLKELVTKVRKIYDQTEQSGRAWIPAADGRRIYCDSPHKALNYLLQSFEAISCKAALSYQMAKFREENLTVYPLIWYHDENEVECPKEQAERVKEIMIESYREGGKQFEMMILDGAGKIGDNWYDVH